MKLYTVAEARALLPRVIPVLESLRDAYVEMRAVQASVAALSRGASGDGHLLVDPEDGGHTAWRCSTGRCGRQRRRSTPGIEVKDLARGLIDFYHERRPRGLPSATSSASPPWPLARTRSRLRRPAAARWTDWRGRTPSIQCADQRQRHSA